MVSCRSLLPGGVACGSQGGVVQLLVPDLRNVGRIFHKHQSEPVTAAFPRGRAGPWQTAGACDDITGRGVTWGVFTLSQRGERHQHVAQFFFCVFVETETSVKTQQNAIYSVESFELPTILHRWFTVRENVCFVRSDCFL